MVAIDPSTAFRKAITGRLLNTKITVDPFHLVQLANLCFTRVRQQLAQHLPQHRGRATDSVWATGCFYYVGYDTLTPAGRQRLHDAFTSDDPVNELGTSWGIKEALRLILAATSLEKAHTAKTRFNDCAAAADTPETDRRAATITAWWPAKAPRPNANSR